MKVRSLWISGRNGSSIPLKEWKREFQAVLVTAGNKFATFENVKREARFLDTADTFRTPGKRKRNLDAKNSIDDPLTKTRPMKYERVLPSKEGELEKVVQYGVKNKGVLTGIVSNLETNMIAVNEVLDEVTTPSKGKETSYCSKFEFLKWIFTSYLFRITVFFISFIRLM